MRFSVSRRRRNSWWKCQLSCLLWRFLSSPLTFQFALGVVLVDVFKVFSLARVPRLWNKSPTFQFLIMVSMEVSKVFTQDRVQQGVRSRSLTFQFFMVACTSKIRVSHRLPKQLLEKHFCRAEKKRAVGSALGVGTVVHPRLRLSWHRSFERAFWRMSPAACGCGWYLLCSDPEVFWDGPG